MNAVLHKGTVTFRDKQIAFEGPREFVEAMLLRFAETTEWDESTNGGTHARLPEASVTSERQWIAEKKPHGHHEIIAVLGFALAESGTPVFGEDEIRRAYIRAGERPPKVIGQALRDAKNKFEFLEPAGKRGQYRLSDHGDRVVRFDLPRSEGK